MGIPGKWIFLAGKGNGLVSRAALCKSVWLEGKANLLYIWFEWRYGHSVNDIFSRSSFNSFSFSYSISCITETMTIKRIFTFISLAVRQILMRGPCCCRGSCQHWIYTRCMHTWLHIHPFVASVILIGHSARKSTWQGCEWDIIKLQKLVWTQV